MIDLDKLCADALKRIERYVNLSAAQHMFVLRGKKKK